MKREALTVADRGGGEEVLGEVLCEKSWAGAESGQEWMGGDALRSSGDTWSDGGRRGCGDRRR